MEVPAMGGAAAGGNGGGGGKKPNGDIKKKFDKFYHANRRKVRKANDRAQQQRTAAYIAQLEQQLVQLQQQLVQALQEIARLRERVAQLEKIGRSIGDPARPA